ncbi:protein NUCLEAR FUSION DEFECTIVE 6, mitochondrial-like isoform X2 [Tripterygium wilfordii]|uniref:protein NUCLEAR FUSION DEFECTIVE 6, mitochondrial-like isoform X2 n=1 Tax=Tripterygium wilfordii TaxID=458696 RepID=UPI0018F82FB9|nr:protein NUCLEAR FUSION DEFECTIVE 6, mitochondrial-like isoform X2 [Tripterygium wilfordii]XP_038682354.1 protein NUCLEAR FUSION DEFECTIVE 6, mitochondrial-like isoform X2 [Tripterygium wilfordii]
MASFAAARCVLRSASVRSAAARLASRGSSAKAAPSPFRTSGSKPLTHRAFRCPVEMSSCVETLLPYHTATASALMTSMLSITRRSYGCRRTR